MKKGKIFSVLILGMLMAAVGAAALWLGEKTLALICAVWGVFGLFQAAHTLNGVIARGELDAPGTLLFVNAVRYLREER